MRPILPERVVSVIFEESNGFLKCSLETDLSQNHATRTTQDIREVSLIGPDSSPDSDYRGV